MREPSDEAHLERSALTGKTALITGITGQDGAYLAELLLGKGYVVHGLRRRSSSSNTARIDHLHPASCDADGPFCLHHGDMTEPGGLVRLLKDIQPDEIYNLAAQSHVQVSFDAPASTAAVNAMGTVHLLDAIRSLGMEASTRFFQASTSELYGKVQDSPQHETTPFCPCSPYGAAKLYGFWMTVTYRDAYGMHASNGILFNHESPIRGETFVTRKITRAVAAIAHGLQERLTLGNLDARRDWGHARDFVHGMWLMLQQDEPDDYVLATGKTYTVREFVEMAFRCVDRTIVWRGKGASETGVCTRTGDVLVAVDSRCFRPTDVDRLQGDPSKARKRLGWRHTTPLPALVDEMVAHDLNAVRRDAAHRTWSD